MMLSFADGLARAAEAGVRVAIVTGGPGTAFCSGYDLAALPAPDPAVDDWESRFPELTAMLESFERFEAPIVAAVNGHAIGAGALIAAAADFRIAQRGSFFRIPAVRLGVLYPLAGIRRLTALVGLDRASRILLLGDDIDADTAVSWGLYTESTDAADVLPRAEAFAARLVQRAPLTVAGLRSLLRADARHAADDAVRTLHRAWATRCLGSSDLAEGLAAALARRAPRFEGR
jgi:enoyl-CoA hydratase/carnithine racemase